MDVTIACPCPPKDGQPRHESDTVTLRDKLDYRAALTLRNMLSTSGALTLAEQLTLATECYLRFGIEAWSLTDEKGKPLPVTWDNTRDVLLVDVDTALLLDTETDRLYAKAVMLPLLRLASGSSQPTPTEPSTSPTTGSEPTPLRRSKRSSTTTSQTDATEPTSRLLAGASS